MQTPPDEYVAQALREYQDPKGMLLHAWACESCALDAIDAARGDDSCMELNPLDSRSLDERRYALQRLIPYHEQSLRFWRRVRETYAAAFEAFGQPVPMLPTREENLAARNAALAEDARREPSTTRHANREDCM